jgi:ketosteroid isomerase-like protein
MSTETSTATREEELLQLNRDYIAASLRGDVAWYREHLAEDFVCIDSDASVLDKAAFLKQTAEGSDLAEYRLQEVDLRFYGDVALVRATGAWIGKNGKPGISRYLDVYVRKDGAWKAVSAQITRPAPGA